MTILSIDLPPDVYERLRRIADTRGTSAEDLAQAWLEEKTAAEPAPETMRERMRAALRAHGLLAEPTEAMRRLADESTLTLGVAPLRSQWLPIAAGLSGSAPASPCRHTHVRASSSQAVWPTKARSPAWICSSPDIDVALIGSPRAYRRV